MGAGIAVASFGQAMTTRALPDELSRLLPFADQLTDVYPEPASVVVGMILLTAGAILFAVVGSPFADNANQYPLAPSGRGFQLGPAKPVLPAGAFLAGLALFGVLISQLYWGDYAHWLIVIFLLSMALLAVPFAVLGPRPLKQQRPRLIGSQLSEGLVLGVLISMFMLLAVRDLSHWRFSFLGDEYPFFSGARDIALGASFNPFSQAGVYEIQPVLSSTYQALFLKLSSGDLFAWKFSLVVLVAATLIPFYLLMRELFTQFAATVATSILAASHYLLGLAHTGYNNLDALFPTALALWLLIVGLKRDSSLALFASGAAAGLGFYTLFSGRATILIIVLFLLTFGVHKLRPRTVLPLAISFAAVAAPIFAVDGWDVIAAMWERSAAAYEVTWSVRVERVAQNVVPSIMAFNYNPDRRAFVTGSLLDPISATLFALGLGVAIWKMRDPRFRLLVIWWAVAVVVNGFAHQRSEVAITRLHYALLPAAAFAGIALDMALTPLLRLVQRPAARSVLVAGALLVFMVPMLYLNLDRMWVDSDRGTLPEATAVGAVLDGPCQGEESVIVAPFPTNLNLFDIVNAYNLGERTPTIFSYEQAFAPGALAEWSLDGCIVVIPDPPAPGSETEFDVILRELLETHPDKQPYVFNGKTKVLVLR